MCLGISAWVLRFDWMVVFRYFGAECLVGWFIRIVTCGLFASGVRFTV